MKDKKKPQRGPKPLVVGDYNHFDVKKKTQKGFYIQHGELELFVPKKELSPKIQEGHKVKLFVYNSGKGGIRVSSGLPLALVNQFAYLRVKEVRDFGAFLEWGIPKDLFIPKRNLKEDVQPGDSIIVRLIPDHEENQVIATALWEEYIDEKPSQNLRVNQEASLLVVGIKDLGLRVIVNQRYLGMIYKDQGLEKIKYGQRLKGYISKIRRDGRIDIGLKKRNDGNKKESPSRKPNKPSQKKEWPGQNKKGKAFKKD